MRCDYLFMPFFIALCSGKIYVLKEEVGPVGLKSRVSIGLFAHPAGCVGCKPSFVEVGWPALLRLRVAADYFDLVSHFAGGPGKRFC